MTRLRFGVDGERMRLAVAAREFFSAALALLPGDSAQLSASERARAVLEGGLCREVQRVHPGLTAELVLGGTQPLVAILPRSDDGLGVLAEEVIAEAPRCAGLTFVRHLPELSSERATLDVLSRTGLALDRARARIGFSRGHLLEAVVYSPVYSSAAEEHVLSGAELLLRRLVGDACFDDWFACVDVAPLPRGGPLRVLTDRAVSTEDTLPLADVLPAVSRAIASVLQALPAEPYHTFCDRAEWTVFELEPAVLEDYVGLEDVAIFSTMLPEAMKSFLEGARFSSRRFSRHGERFVVVKLDTAHLSPRERLERRAAIEDDLDRALVPGRFGCVIGAGVGLRYVYAVLAVTELDRALDIMVRRLRRAEVHERSWISFCDADWAHEWVGVHPGTPPPPRAPSSASR